MERRLAHYSGFTLIEIVVTTAITAVVVGGAIAGFISFADRQEVLNTAKEAQQLLRTAQARARIKEVPSDCNADKLVSYKVTGASNTLAMTAVCGVTAYEIPITTFTVPAGVAISFKNPPTTSSTATFTFPVLEQGGTSTIGWPATLIFTKGTNTFSFTISTRGSMSNVQ